MYDISDFSETSQLKSQSQGDFHKQIFIGGTQSLQSLYQLKVQCILKTMEYVEWMKEKYQLKIDCQSRCNKNAEDLQEKLQNKRNFYGMEQTSHSFGQCYIVLQIMTYVRNMPTDIKENYRNKKKKAIEFSSEITTVNCYVLCS